MQIEHISEDYVETIKSDEFAIFIFYQVDDKTWNLLFSLDPNITDIDPYELGRLGEESETDFLFFPNYETKGEALQGLGETMFNPNSDYYYIDTYELSDEAVWYISLITHSEYKQIEEVPDSDDFELNNNNEVYELEELAI